MMILCKTNYSIVISEMCFKGNNYFMQNSPLLPLFVFSALATVNFPGETVHNYLTVQEGTTFLQEGIQLHITLKENYCNLGLTLQIALYWQISPLCVADCSVWSQLDLGSLELFM